MTPDIARLVRIAKTNGYMWSEGHLKHTYNLDRRQVMQILKAQDGYCALCGGDLDGERWAIDHKHGTKLVRGILHHGCNTGLGKLYDSPAVLRKAIIYLQTAHARLGLDEEGNAKV